MLSGAKYFVFGARGTFGCMPFCVDSLCDYGVWRDNCSVLCVPPGRLFCLILPIAMYIASQKRKENIAEYLLYMWQVEDVIRAYNLDIDRIDEFVIRPMGLDAEHTREIHGWYVSLIDMMRREEVEKSGHLQINRNTLSLLVDLHRRLLSNPKFAEYSAQLYKTLPFIVELRAKGGASPAGELETCFNALYGILVLRLRGREVSKETADAVAQISKLLGMLAAYFKFEQEDRLDMGD